MTPAPLSGRRPRMRARSEAGRRRSPIGFPAPGADPFRCAGATDGLRIVPPRFDGLRLGGWRKADGRWRGRGGGAFRPLCGGWLRLRRRFRRRNGSAGLSFSGFRGKRARRLRSAARALFLCGNRLGVAGGPRRGGGLFRTASRLLRSAAFSLLDRSDGGIHFEPEQRRDSSSASTRSLAAAVCVSGRSAPTVETIRRGRRRAD